MRGEEPCPGCGAGGVLVRRLATGGPRENARVAANPTMKIVVCVHCGHIGRWTKSDGLTPPDLETLAIGQAVVHALGLPHAS